MTISMHLTLHLNFKKVRYLVFSIFYVRSTTKKYSLFLLLFNALLYVYT